MTAKGTVAVATPELEVAQQLMQIAMGTVDEANRRLLDASKHLGQRERARLQADFQASLAIRLVAMFVSDEKSIEVVANGVIEMLAEIRREDQQAATVIDGTLN